MDNLFTGKRKNIEHWIGHPNFTFFQHDVINPFHIEVDQIYHLACPASPPHYMYNAIKVRACGAQGGPRDGWLSRQGRRCRDFGEEKNSKPDAVPSALLTRMSFVATAFTDVIALPSRRADGQDEHAGRAQHAGPRQAHAQPPAADVHV
jgi:hypothetical protein